MNLYSRLSNGFPASRDAPCFILGDGATMSYAALEAGVGRAARLLQERGVAAGDRVLVQTPKSPEAVMLYLGVLMAGGVYAPLNTAYTQAEVDYFIADAEPRLFLRDAVAFMNEARKSTPLDRAVERGDEDLASLIYTSGTTGKPKGAMLTHGGLAANARALTDLWRISRDDVLLHALPIFHVHGLFVAMHCAFLAGCPMAWLAKFDVDEVIQRLPSASVMMGIPTFYSRLLAEESFTRERAAHMRLFISGSAPMLETTFTAFEQRTGHRILERYGMSEAAIITSNPVDGERRAGSVGYPVPGFDVRITGGSPGMIEIRGPSLFKAYWRKPEKTAEDFTADGYFITGDLGHMDADGRVYISGRAKDLIISGGFNVYPKEVELALDELPDVDESAVIGIPHPDFGEAVVAIVTGGATEAQLLQQVRERLAAFKVPKRIFTVAELPRNAMGKVQKARLRELYGETFVGGRP